MKLRSLTMIPLAFALTATAALRDGGSYNHEEGIALTIYNQNFGVVREKRNVDVKEKTGTIRLLMWRHRSTVPACNSSRSPTRMRRCWSRTTSTTWCPPTSCSEKYIDKQIAVLTKDGSRYSGSLLSFDANQLVIRQEGEKAEIVMVQRGDNVKDIQFGALPEGLITKPTLVWKLATEKVGQQLIEVAYQTAGINWQADYNAMLNPNDTKLDLGGWVTINNQSGATYKDAKLKLMAGDVRRVAADGGEQRAGGDARGRHGRGSRVSRRRRSLNITSTRWGGRRRWRRTRPSRSSCSRRRTCR